MEAGVMLSIVKLLWEYLFKDRLGLNKSKSGRRKNLVRLIGSVLPLPPAKRVYFNIAAWNSCMASKTPSEIFSDDFLNESISTDDDHGETFCSHKSEIQQLQDELKQLRKQVAMILENQMNASSDKKCETSVMAPPPPPPVPPPPPPPIPVNLLINATAPPSFKLPKGKKSRYSTPPTTVDMLGEVLKQMSKERPQLKPIQRSPGGRPVRPPRVSQDPSDILTEVLKRRFRACQNSDTNESDTSFTEVLSPDRKSCHL